MTGHRGQLVSCEYISHCDQHLGKLDPTFLMAITKFRCLVDVMCMVLLLPLVGKWQADLMSLSLYISHGCMTGSTVWRLSLDSV